MIEVARGEAPLIVGLPHSGTDIPRDIAATLADGARALEDTDWWTDRLYAFAVELGATMVRTPVSRTVIDVNRDPSGASLYPGQTTTELCPTSTFEGERLYLPGLEPDAGEIARRRSAYFDPFHAALAAEIARLRAIHPRVVLYDAHSIRSIVPRLFEGELPHFNIGVNDGVACDPGLVRTVEAVCDATVFSRVTDGRFKGGWITRRYGRPVDGVHALQMELARRGYLREPSDPRATPEWDAAFAEPMQAALARLLRACLAFAEDRPA